MDPQILDGGWHKLGGSFNSGSLSAVQVLMYDSSAGNSYIDDFNLDTPAANLVQNSGFESGSANWIFGGPFSVTTADKNSGSSSLLIAGTGSWGTSRSAAIAVSPNTQYSFSYYLKSTSNKLVQLVDGPGSWNGISGMTMDSQILDGAWHKLSGSFNSGSLSAVQVLMYDSSAGNSYIDDLSLTPSVAAGTYYVSTSGRDDTGTGSSSSPWKTVAYAASHVRTGASSTVGIGATM